MGKFIATLGDKNLEIVYILSKAKTRLHSCFSASPLRISAIMISKFCCSFLPGRTPNITGKCVMHVSSAIAIFAVTTDEKNAERSFENK